MPRLARNVFAGIPHHITQRGNRREDIFFTDEDRYAYLAWLKEYCREHRVDVLAYCLMTNHIHLVLVPSEEDGLSRVLKPLHMRYAQRINKAKGWKGHLWQGRYFSSPLDDAYLWAAIRYVERNPVRAKVVRHAERYPWSSAAAHCGLYEDSVLTQKQKWQKQFAQIDNWRAWLAEGENENQLTVIRRNIDKGLPCGSERFIKKLETLTGNALQYRPQGRPKKLEPEADV
ncbi:MAG: transposase [Gammaproteobacteria bacterium]|nr:transposase [Gammaproteobacteria bacterium]